MAMQPGFPGSGSAFGHGRCGTIQGAKCSVEASGCQEHSSMASIGGFSLRSGRWPFTLVFVSVVQSGSVLACLHGAGLRPTVVAQERPGAAGGVAKSVARRGRGLGALCRSAGGSSLCRLSVSGVFLAVVVRRMYFRVAARHLSCHVGVGADFCQHAHGQAG